MTPKEKAKELIEKYILIYIDNPKFRNEYIELAKESSLLCVSEILKTIKVENNTNTERLNRMYWINVAEEIRNL